MTHVNELSRNFGQNATLFPIANENRIAEGEAMFCKSQSFCKNFALTPMFHNERTHTCVVACVRFDMLMSE